MLKFRVFTVKAPVGGKYAKFGRCKSEIFNILEVSPYLFDVLFYCKNKMNTFREI
jgi:hypothetical protein